MIICKNDKELEKALEARERRIILEGPHASSIISRMEEADRKRSNARITTGILGALCLLAVPFTGGGSLAALGATAAVATTAAISTEVALAIITAIVTISTAAIDAMKEYNIRRLDYNRVELTRR